MRLRLSDRCLYRAETVPRDYVAVDMDFLPTVDSVRCIRCRLDYRVAAFGGLLFRKDHWREEKIMFEEQ